MLKRIAARLIFILFSLIFGSAYAAEFQFDEVSFNRENNGGGALGYSQLEFQVTNPRIGSKNYRNLISFTLDTDRAKGSTRTDIRFANDWLEHRWYQSSSSTDSYLGSGRLSYQQGREVNALSADEKIILGWIVTNADELIEFALGSGKFINPVSRKQWERMDRNEFFENNLRKNFARLPSIQAEIIDRDQYAKHTPSLLKNFIQPPLKKLGYYNGAIDGLIGPGTIGAIKEFERKAGLFPDGVLRTGKELSVLDEMFKNALNNTAQIEDVERSQKNGRFARLDQLAQGIRLANFNFDSFPNENDKSLVDIILEPSFRQYNRWQEFKLNGHYNKTTRQYVAGDLCLITHNSSDEPLCLNHLFTPHDKKKLEKYLRMSSRPEIDLTYLKCGIVVYRYDDLYQSVRSASFERGLYKQYRKAYLDVASQCMDSIIDTVIKPNTSKQSVHADNTNIGINRFTELDNLTVMKGLVNLRSNARTDDNNNNSQILTLQGDFYLNESWQQVKLVGYRQKISGRTSIGQICITSPKASSDELCLHTNFSKITQNRLTDYLKSADTKETETVYFQCAMIRDKIDLIVGSVASNALFAELFVKSAEIYSNTGKRCTEVIKKYHNHIDDDAEKTSNSSANSDIQQLQEQVMSLQSSLDQARAVSANRLNIIFDLRTKLNTRDQNTELEAQMSKLLSDFKEQSLALDKAEKEITKLTQALKGEKVISDSRIKTINDLKRRLAAQSSKLTNAQIQLSKLEASKGAKEVVDETPIIDQLRSEVALLTKNLNAEKVISDARTKKIKDLQRRIAVESSKYANAQVQLSKLQAADKNLNSSKAELENTRKELAEKLTLISRLQADLKVAASPDQENIKKIKALESKLLDTQDKLAAKEAKFSEYKDEINGKLTSAELEEKRLSNVIAKLNSSLEVAEQNSKQNLIDLTQKERELSVLSSKLTAAQDDATSLTLKVINLETQLSSTMSSKDARIEELEAKITNLSDELKAALEQKAVEMSESQGFQLSDEWNEYKQWITPSQMRFCNILHEYEIARNEAANSGNQLLQNMAIKQRDRDIAALLTSSRNGPSGFRNWVSVVQSVFAMDSVNPETGQVELAAGVILDTPCGISVGTGRVLDSESSAKSEFKYLAFENDLIFSQLASVRRGDPVLFDGSFAKAENGSTEMFITNELGEEEKIDAYEKPNDAPDMFVDISYLAKL